MEATRICTVETCKRREVSRGLCGPHYKRAMRAGGLPPLRDRRRESEARFWGNVEKTATCWLWRGYVTKYGYGSWNPHRGVNRRAHRVAWEYANGPVPNGLVLDHLCRVRHCVRPDHLEPVSMGVNARRGIGPSALNARKAKCRRGHAFTPDNTMVSAGRRICRTCRREWKEARTAGAAQCISVAKSTGDRCRKSTTSPDGRCVCHAH